MTTPPLEAPEPDDEIRVLPRNETAERALLGAMILSDTGRRDVLTESSLSADDFSKPAHGLVWDAIVRLDAAGEQVDPTTVLSELIRSGDLRAAGGGTMLADLIAEPSAPAAALTYASAVAEAATFRRLVIAGTQIAQLGYALGDAGMAAATARSLVDVATEGATGSSGPKPLADQVEALLDHLDHPADTGPQVLWPWRDMREVMNPLEPGQLVLIGARPGVGKSVAGATGFGVDVARTGVPILEVTLEMSAREYLARKLSHISRVPLQRMKRRDLSEHDWQDIAKAQDVLSSLPVVVDDSETVTLEYVRAAIRRGVPMPDGTCEKPRVVVIDYVQLMTPTGKFGNRQEEVASLARGLKRLAKAERVTIVGLVQLNRGPDGRSDKTPVVADIRESGQLENDADIIVLLHRPDMYEKECARAGEIDLIVAKNRDGWTGTITASFAGHRCSIYDMASEDVWGRAA